jgi:hypothetical protein
MRRKPFARADRHTARGHTSARFHLHSLQVGIKFCRRVFKFVPGYEVGFLCSSSGLMRPGHPCAAEQTFSRAAYV